MNENKTSLLMQQNGSPFRPIQACVCFSLKETGRKNG